MLDRFLASAAHLAGCALGTFFAYFFVKGIGWAWGDFMWGWVAASAVFWAREGWRDGL